MQCLCEGPTHLTVSIFVLLLLVFSPQVMFQVLGYSAGADIPGSSHVFMSCETKLPISLRLQQFQLNLRLLSM